MKNYFVFIFILLLISCNSDDDATPTEQDNIGIAPSGALIKIEALFPIDDFRVNSDFIYNSYGKINSAVTTTSQSGYDNSAYTQGFELNAQGQIWKTLSSNTTTEYLYSNELIVSSINTSITTGTITTTAQYTYNNNEELIKAEYFDSNNILTAEVVYTYDANGNILTRDMNSTSGNNQSYVFEYDTNPNPMSTVYGNQGYGKILEITPNNRIKRTFDNNGTVIVFTAEYTYNSNGYPITETEHKDATTLVEETTFTYQP